MASTASRVRGSLLGASVADAAARPLHWIYKADVLEAILSECRAKAASASSSSTKSVADFLAFYPESKSPFYSLPTGCVSCYNDQALVCLRTLKENNGRFDVEAFCRACVTHFGANSSYAEAFAKRKENYDAGKKNEWKGPVEGPWLHRCQKYLLQNFEDGVRPTGYEESDESDGFVASIPVICVSLLKNEKASDEEVLAEAKKAMDCLAKSEISISHGMVAARVLLEALRGESDPVDCVLQKLKMEGQYTHVIEEIEKVMQRKTDDHVQVVADFGKACGYPGSFMGALHAIINHWSYPEAIANVISAGGCNCSRANFVGAVAGAMNPEAIPSTWICKTFASKELLEDVDTLVKQLSANS